MPCLGYLRKVTFKVKLAVIQKRVFLFSVKKNACFNYREFDLEGDLLGLPNTWYLSAQSFITLLKLV